jgi:16S rRNA (guanine527-N7)-methyltransferase
MNKITDLEIQNVIAPYGITSSPELCDQIRTYVSLLLKWNQKISLSTVTNPTEILRFHFGESFFAASKVPIEKGRLADVGSGAGFPGLPIRMLSAPIGVTLIESHSKKSAFLYEIVRSLKLDHVSVFNGRMDALPSESLRFDFVVARALGQHDEFLSWSSSRLNSGGKVILWLGEKDASVISGNPAWNWQEPLKIPLSERRFLLIGTLPT